MKLKSTIPPAIVTAAVGMLQEFSPELSPAVLVEALRMYEPEALKPASPAKALPVTRKEAARRLGVSLPTINRYCNSGLLKKIKIGKRLARISSESLDAILNPEA